MANFSVVSCNSIQTAVVFMSPTLVDPNLNSHPVRGTVINNLYTSDLGMEVGPQTGVKTRTRCFKF